MGRSEGTAVINLPQSISVIAASLIASGAVVYVWTLGTGNTLKKRNHLEILRKNVIALTRMFIKKLLNIIFQSEIKNLQGFWL